jgi:hypothetical protein
MSKAVRTSHRRDFSRASVRRGNTIVLVTAILVLLVVVATAFVSRTQASRVAAGAHQQARAVDQRKSPILNQIADQVAQSLFVRPVQVLGSGLPDGWTPGDPAVARSSVPRRDPLPTAVRYGVDFLDAMDNRNAGAVPGGDGVVDGYNFAPFMVFPWTNWPDVYGPGIGYGPVFPWPPVASQVALDGNPVGNPGFGDTRWLRSTEPARTTLPTAPGGTPREFFTHWPHLSWIPTAENGWRVCIDISDLGSGSLIAAPLSMQPAAFFPSVPYNFVPPAVGANLNRWGLDVPYEQWLADAPPALRWIQATGIDIGKLGAPVAAMTPECAAYWFRLLAFGNAVQPPLAPFQCSNAGGFAGVPGGWFSPNHWSVMQQPQFVMPNFLQLKWFGPESDEFVCDSPRNVIARTLADSDGDGFTDSFWFVAPASVDRSIKHVVAVSVVDNTGLLNVNVASRFDRTNTVGSTPADVALVTRMDTNNPVRADVPVGFLNNPLNWVVWPRNPPVAIPVWDRLPSPTTGAQSLVLNSDRQGALVFNRPLPPPGWGVADPGYPLANTSASAGPEWMDVGFNAFRWGVDGNTGAVTGGPNDPTFLRETGVLRELPSGTAQPVPTIEDSPFRLSMAVDIERRRYFKAMADGGRVGDYVLPSANPPFWRAFLANGSSPHAEPSGVPTLLPFGMADEYELRARHGSNDPALLSRLERALDSNNLRFLRSSALREETSEYFDSLTNDQLLHDNRRKITTVNGARNDMMPPWMWTLPPVRGIGQPELRSAARRTPYLPWGLAPVLREPSYGPAGPQPVFLPRIGFAPGPDLAAQYLDGDADGDGIPGTARDETVARQAYLDWNRKLDLNEPYPTSLDANAGEYGRLVFESIYSWLNRLTSILQMSFIDRRGQSAIGGAQPIYTLFGGYDRATNAGNPNAEVWSQRLAASWAANILAARDRPVLSGIVERDQPLPPALGLQVVSPGAPNDPMVFIGQEPQPFIAQAFFAFVYPRSRVSDTVCNLLQNEGQLWPGDTCPGANRMPVPFIGGGEYFINYDRDDPAAIRPAPVLVVQIVNPYNQPINLRNFTLTAFGRSFNFSQQPNSGWGYGIDPILGPATEESPRSAIVFACPKELGGDPNFRAKMMGFLDITHDWFSPTGTDPSGNLAIGQNWPANLRTELSAAQSELGAQGITIFPTGPGGALGSDLFEDPNTVLADTLVFNASEDALGQNRGWSTDEQFYRDLFQGLGVDDQTIELRRKVSWVGPDPTLQPPPGTPPAPVEVVVDRLRNAYDPNQTSVLAGGGSAGAGSNAWNELLRRIATDPRIVPPEVNAVYSPDNPPERNTYDALLIGQKGLWYSTWARVSRPWVWDVNQDGAITADERSPRFVIAAQDEVVQASPQGNSPANPHMVIGGARTFGIQGDVALENTSPDGAPFVPTSPTQNLWMVRPAYTGPLGYSVIGKPTNFTLRTVALAADNPTRRLRIYPDFRLLSSAEQAPGFNVIGNWPGVVGANAPPSEILGDTGAERFVHQAFRHPWRMTHRDGNFEQVAEIYDVPVYGPVLEANTVFGNEPRTIATFGELMAGAPAVDLNSPQARQQVVFPDMPAQAMGRFALEPRRPTPNQGFAIGSLPDGSPNARLQQGYVPALPAGTAVLDCLTIDGGGARPDTGWSMEVLAGAPPAERLRQAVLAEERSPRLARGFRGEATPGLINVNTAPVEVLRALPNMTALSLNDDALGGAMPNMQNGAANPQAGVTPDTLLFQLPRTRLPETIINYRDQTLAYPGPAYVDRGFAPGNFSIVGAANQQLDLMPFHPGMRRERGIASVGELALMNRHVGWGPQDTPPAGIPFEPNSPAAQTGNWSWNRSWSVDFAGNDPFRADEGPAPPPTPAGHGGTVPTPTPFAPAGAGYTAPGTGPGGGPNRGLAARMSTDRAPITVQRPQPFTPGPDEPFIPELPRTAGDQFEKNLLLKGVANLVTTRSDVFTVYVKIRSVAQNAGSGKWDATDPKNVIEDTRWVMVVDRSRVNQPGDQAEILMMQRVP